MRCFKVCLLLVLLLSFSKACPEILKDRLVLSQLVHEIRDPSTDKKHFRKALEKIGEYLTLEVLQDLNTKHVEIETLMRSKAVHALCDEDPVLITILRGGIPMMIGMQKVFPNAEAGFLGMARNEETLKAAISYIGIPNVHGKCVIIADTMLATGGSLLDAIKIVEKQNPKQIILVCAIAAKKGIERILDHNPNIKIFAAATDPIQALHTE